MAIFGGFLFVAFIQRAIGLDRRDAFVGCGAGGVQLAGQNGFGVRRFQYKPELTGAALTHFVPSGHAVSPWRLRGCALQSKDQPGKSVAMGPASTP
ncbi:hypothetical protein D3C85_1511890 [compost metagenome]